MADAPAAGEPNTDPGRRSMMLNVLTNWVWYGLVVISGFLIPRLIDQKLGAVQLGVWDLCWSLASFVGLLSLGITSAVGRYVARLRAGGDWSALNEVMNSSLLLLSGGFLLAVALVVAVDWIALLTPPADRERLGGAGRTLALLLVGAAALQLPAGVYNAVITGWERFDQLNLIRATRDVAGMLLMMAALYAGYGLLTMGWINLVLEVLASIAKWWAARRLCPQMRHALHFCRSQTMRELTSFGGKTVIQEFARTGPQQAANLVISRVLGPEALAVFARQRNLVMHAYRFTKQYAQVFVPRSAALQARADDEEMRALLIAGSRGGFFVALPMLLTFAIAGGDLLELWMGPAYRQQAVLAVLAVGHILALGQQSVLSMLMGMGRHGWAAAAEALFAIGGIIVLVIWTGWLGGGLLAAAIVISAVMTLTGGLIIPWYACRLLHLGFATYLRQSIVRPLLCVLPFAAVLAGIQVAPIHDYKLRLLLSVVIGGIVLAVTYAVFALPPAARQRLLRKFGIATAAAGAHPEPLA